jgi:hypothetical protein
MLRDGEIPYLEEFASDHGQRLPVWFCGLVVFALSAACYRLLFEVGRMLLP